MPAMTIADADGVRWTAVGFDVEKGTIVWVPADTKIATFDLAALIGSEDGDTDAP